MADVYSKETRSYTMSRVRSKNTKPEMLVRKFLYNNGFRYRIHLNTLLGKPDIVLSKYKTLIFIHGCFWHGHALCKKNSSPTNNFEYWNNKIKTNIDRDKLYEAKLSELGWNIIVIWECQLKRKTMDQTLAGLLNELNKFRCC